MHLSIEEAIEELKAGRILIVVDDENRENEGDLICPAETITAEGSILLSPKRGDSYARRWNISARNNCISR
jgi:3,4-dihydroxy-2-butanone 4-phosphate synthase